MTRLPTGQQHWIEYRRVSTQDDAEGSSTDHQGVINRGFTDRLQWGPPAMVFTDAGESGDLDFPDRPGARAMQDYIAATPELAFLVCTEPKRLTRRLRHGVCFLEDYLDRFQVEPVLTLDSIDLSSDSGRALLMMVWTMGEHERRTTKRKIKAGMKAGREGGLSYGQPPYGARPVARRTGQRRDAGKRERDPDTWPWLKRIFKARLRGWDAPKIARHLNRLGVAPARGAQWCAETIRGIVSNRWYLGRRRVNGVLVRLDHNCRVPRRIWRAAQFSPQERGLAGRKPAAYPYLLRWKDKADDPGLVVCSHFKVTYPPDLAGKPLPLRPQTAYGRGKKAYPYYRRLDEMKDGGGTQAELVEEAGKDLPMIPARDLDNMVIQRILEDLTPERAPWLSERAELTAVRLSGKVEAELKSARRRQAALAIQRQRLQARVVDEALAGDRREVLAALEEKLQEISHHLQELDQAVDALKLAHAAAETERAFARRLPERLSLVQALYEREKWEELTALLGALVWRVDVRMDGTRVYYRPSPTLAACLALCGITKSVDLFPAILIPFYPAPRRRRKAA